MTAPAMAFRAAYSDFKLIKTRGVVSISFEVPVEQAESVLKVLGGMPLAAKEIWCAVARLEPETEVMQSGRQPNGKSNQQNTETSPRQEPSTPDGAKTKTAFRDMRPANQAGILCDTPAFHRFLAERTKSIDPNEFNSERSAEYVRRICNVASRGDIRPRTPSGDKWQRLFSDYQVWLHALEPA